MAAMIPQGETATEFDVRIQVQLEKYEVYDDRGTLRRTRSPEQMSITEVFRIPAAGFMEIAAILGQFNGLADRIKTQYE